MNPPTKISIPLFPIALILALAAFLGVFPNSQAVSPPPDGGYPGGNTAEGENALFSLTMGFYNTAVGYLSLKSDTTGSFNTAIGAGALHFNTGAQNTATGAGALLSNTTGSNNTAMGESALFFNTTATDNTAIGANTLTNNITGADNIAIGVDALFNNTASNNTAIGTAALSSTTTGGDNTAIGRTALTSNTTGSDNVAVGEGAGINLTTGNHNIYIGNAGVANENNVIRIGEMHGPTFISGITGAPVTGAVVVVNTSGQLGVAPSSERFKDKIKSMDKTSESILALKPVAFYYKKEIEPKEVPQFGLVAEEVEKVNPDLVVRDKDGRPYTVRYDAINAMLLNEFLKEHKKNEAQEATIARLQKQVEALTAGLQKVSAQLEVGKPRSQVVNNP